MAFADLLISTCIVSRYSSVSSDAYGQPIKTWVNIPPWRPCRLSMASGKEIQVGAEVVLADAKLFIGDVDITEKDRVVIGPLTYEVLFVATVQDGAGDHHKECYLRVVR